MEVGVQGPGMVKLGVRSPFIPRDHDTASNTSDALRETAQQNTSGVALLRPTSTGSNTSEALRVSPKAEAMGGFGLRETAQQNIPTGMVEVGVHSQTRPRSRGAASNTSEHPSEQRLFKPRRKPFIIEE